MEDAKLEHWLDEMKKAVLVTGWLAFSGCQILGQQSPASDKVGVDEVEALGDDLALEERVEAESPPALPLRNEPSTVAFDLLVNRPLAHRMTSSEQGTSFWVDGTTPDFVRYVQGNHSNDWYLFAQVDKTALSATKGREAQLVMPGGESEEAVELELSVFNPVRGQNELSITFNDVELESVSLSQGWQSVRVHVPGQAVRAENRIAFSFSNLGRIEGRLSGGGVSWIRLGPSRRNPEEGPDEPTEFVGLGDGDGGRDETKEEVPDENGERPAPGEEAIDPVPVVPDVTPHQHVLAQQTSLVLDGDDGLAWTVWLHEDAFLALDLVGTPECGVTVEVEIEKGNGLVGRHLREERLLVMERGERQATTIDLGLAEAQVGRIQLWRSGSCESIQVEQAMIRRPVEPLSRPEDYEPPKYVLFWVIDTLRADYLPMYSETDVHAPNLARLVAEGVNFQRAYVQGTESRASHATLFTGNYPERHGVMARGRVDRNLKVLPMFAQELGYETGLYASNGYLSHLLNLNRGWDHYQNNIHLETGLDAKFMVSQGIRWMESRLDAPFFLYLGTIDPHVTYRRHPEVIERYEPEPYQGRFQRYLSGEELGQIKGGYLRVSDREKEWIINLYKNEITYNDMAFGELRATLEEWGIWEDTLVVVTSDHGEEFWEHGSVGHGHNVHQEMVHVPLIFHYPRGLPAGRVVASGGEVADVLPTVVELLGGEVPEGRQGRSLLPEIYGEDGEYPAMALATQYGLHYGVQIMDWKLYLRPGRIRFYDRRSDPRELIDIGFSHPLASRMLLDAVGWFRAYRAEWEKSTWGLPNNLSPEFLANVWPAGTVEEADQGGVRE